MILVATCLSMYLCVSSCLRVKPHWVLVYCLKLIPQRWIADRHSGAVGMVLLTPERQRPHCWVCTLVFLVVQGLNHTEYIVWNWSSTLRVLMSWYFGARTSAATRLRVHPCLSIFLRVKPYSVYCYDTVQENEFFISIGSAGGTPPAATGLSRYPCVFSCLVVELY